MGVKIRGTEQVKKKLDDTVDDLRGRKAVRAIQSAMFIVGTEAASMVPRDTGTLVNSQYRELTFVGTVISGRVGFSANYAAYVHDAPGKLKGQPRASVNSFTTSDGRVAFGSNQGNFWDPHGEPQFLKKAEQKTKAQVLEIIKKELSL